MARKKIVFVIVEGTSDDLALHLMFDKFFDQNEVYVKIMYGDITSDMGSSSTNIVSKIGKTITDYAKSNHFRKTDFQEIIHIIDTDGVFVPDDSIVEDCCVEKNVYSTSFIATKNKERTKKRNERKRENVNKLCVQNSIWNIPYKIYFMSCNLDHVLYNKLNSNSDEKERDSFGFAKKYKNNLSGFIHFLSESDFSVTDDYKESWNFIRLDNNSLKRHTNLGIVFKSDA